jgi:GH15 family glucan-1,4-alpha-glucosidase
VTSIPPPFALREYAFLADGERGVLLGPRGEMAWMSFPVWDSPSVFSSLLGGHGSYQVSPAGERFVWGGYYDESTLIWNDRWVTPDATMECREALAFPAEPTSAVILRRIKAVDGRARVAVRLDLRAEYGQRPMTRLHSHGGIWTGTSGPVHLRWRSGTGVHRLRNGELHLQMDLDEGEQHDLILELSLEALSSEMLPAEELWKATEESWQQSVPSFEHTPARRDASHAFAVLRGLTTARGPMVAAATTSLPERAEAGRNYDYRYAWIRDQCFAAQAVATFDGGELLLDSAVRFVTERLHADGPDLKPAYRATGDPVPAETELTHLPGYPGGQVKLGNQVNTQFQLDGLGECLLLMAAADRRDRLDLDHWKAVGIAVEAIAARWQQPDAGIWELDDHWWTHSRLTCVAGLRQVAARVGGAESGRWTAFADTIAAEVARTCLHSSGRWQRAPDDPRVDAALLLPAIRGAIPVDDPRTLSTLAAIERELIQDGYVYRYRHDDRPLEEAEGAFSLCGFALALTYLQLGRREDAVAWFERNRASCGPPGLLTEEFDVGERQLRGNIPQAFVHAMLLETAVRLGSAADPTT